MNWKKRYELITEITQIKKGDKLKLTIGKAIYYIDVRDTNYEERKQYLGNFYTDIDFSNMTNNQVWRSIMDDEELRFL